MCGIVGTFHFDSSEPVSKELLLRQTDSLAHRGPDAGGLWCDHSIGLGHRRLSIIDLEGGLQPMWDSENRIGIVFNGEIYNYRELRETLSKKGHTFHSDSDTETIIYAYREWGSECVHYFDGMFAFAIYDREEKSLFLARDRLGKKPLYYCSIDGRFTFASELKAIVQDPKIYRKINPEAVMDYFAYNYVPGSQTILQDIHRLPAGHLMQVDHRGISIHKYWDVEFSPQGMSMNQAVDGLLQHIDRAVNLRLRADVPLGAFLSGGIDSSFIVAMMAKHHKKSVLTHTIGFEEQAYDEREYARDTSQHFNTSHFEKVMKVDSTKVLTDLSWFYDEPFGDSSAIPTYYLCQATRQRVTVALSGDGGDENFAGYRRYRFAMAEALVRNRIPRPVRKYIFGGLGKLYPKADYLPRYLRAKATLTNLAKDHERAYFLSLTQKSYPLFLNKDFLFGLRDYDPYVHFEDTLGAVEIKDPLSRLQYIDLKLYLCDDILVKVDRASMAHALEVRVPLLDHHVVQFAATLPSSYKLSGQTSKIALKKAAEETLPRQIFEREKRGFTVPLPIWFRGGLKQRAERVFFDSPGGRSGLLDHRGLQKIWKEHQRGIRNHATSLWSILMFEEWSHRFLSASSGELPDIPYHPTQILTLK